MVRALLFLYAESPVHAGADTSLGAVDLPIQREAGTGLPVIWGQSLKGALRSHARAVWGKDDPRVSALFGDPPPASDTTAADAAAGDTPPGGEAQAGEPRPARPGSLSIGDAQLVGFPAPTLRRTFAWVTSPLALARLRRRTGLLPPGAGLDPAPGLPAATDLTAMAADAAWASDKAVLGPYVLACEAADETRDWAAWLAGAALPAGEEFGFFRDKLRHDLVAVGDEVLTSLTRECAELTPRVQLREDEKTVEKGPFYTEYLPTETLLVSLLEAATPGAMRDLERIVTGRVLHIGGDETIGKGLVWGRLVGIGGESDGAAQN